MKKYLLPVLTILFVLLVSFGTYKYFDIKNKEQNTKINIFPENLPQAKVGEFYKTEIYSGLVGLKREIKIEARKLPEGLDLTNCQTQYNIKTLTKPNSLTTCSIEGNPSVGANTTIQLSASAKGVNTREFKNIQFSISN